MALPPPPPPDPTTDSVVLDKFSGIKNTVSQERLKPEEWASGVNVDLDDAGQLHRRRGYSQVAAGMFTSLFTADNGNVYGVRNGTLCLIHPDYSFEVLVGNVGYRKVAYVQVGDTVYFSSLVGSGKINTTTNTVTPWGAPDGQNKWLSPVVNPTPTLPAVHGKLIGPPPVAEYLAYFNGRIYMAADKTIWATELYLYDYVDKTRTYLMFESETTGLGAVADGIYVGTQSALWFLSGPQFAELKRTMVMNVGVVPGSMVPAPGELADPHNMDQPVESRKAMMFLTDSGVCVGMEGGQSFNITQNHVWFPRAASAAPLFRRQDGVNTYLAVLDSRGTPTDSARIGDYIDAQIIRCVPTHTSETIETGVSVEGIPSS